MRNQLKIRLGATVEIVFETGDIALIDRCDLSLFAAHSWYIKKTKGRVKYLQRNVGQNGVNVATVKFHRELIKPPAQLEIDHINGNGLDNRRCNLRIVTHQENQSNLPDRPHTSRYRYVSWCKKRKTWTAYVAYKSKNTNLGRFETEEQAAVAANNFILKNKLPKRLSAV